VIGAVFEFGGNGVRSGSDLAMIPNRTLERGETV
jgi:hypothetical protein